MPKFNVTSPSGEKFVITAPEGATEEEVLAKAKEYFAQQEPATKERSTLDKVALFLEGNPISRMGRGAFKPFLGMAQKASGLFTDEFNRYVSEEEAGQKRIKSQTTALGLPVGTFGMGPQSGVDIADMVGQGVGYAAPLSKLMPFKNPATWVGRMGNAAAQGGMAGLAMPVTNAEDLTLQDLVTGRKKDNLWGETAKNTAMGAAIGGAASPLFDIGIGAVAAGTNKLGQAATGLANKFSPTSTFMVDMQIVRSLDKQGIDWRLLSDDVKKSLRNEAQRALAVGGKLDEAALARLADYEALGIKPLRSWVTRDASQFTNESNLAKLQANTGGGKLVDAQVQANARLLSTLDNLGANLAGSRYQTAEQAIGAIKKADKTAQDAVDALYAQARALNGGDIPLDARQSLSGLIKQLEADGSLPFLGEFGQTVNNIIAGKMPLTVGNAVGLTKTISRAINSSADGNVRYALGQLKDALDNATPASQLGAQTQAAFQQARDAAKKHFKWQESSPAIEAALNNFAPDRFFERFILNKSANVRDIAEMQKVLTPDVKEETKRLIAQHLRDSAAKGAAQGDLNAVFNQNQYNNAFRAIGKEKMELFFSKQEIQRLEALGRAAYNMKAQPVGSAVNNSNTAAAAFKVLDSIASKLPFGKSAVGDMFQSIGQSRLEAQAVRPQVFEPYRPLDPAQIRGLLGPAAPLTAVGLLGS